MLGKRAATLSGGQRQALARPGASVSYKYIAERLRDIFDDYRVAKVGFDRWGWEYLKPRLSEARLLDIFVLDHTFLPFGHGFQSMSPALRDLESLILDKKLRHGGHPVLNMCAANAVVVRDDADNRKLSKKRARGRIDGMVALAMAIGVAPKGWTAPFDPRALIG
jgi:phage terminase large subunit-like protein